MSDFDDLAFANALSQLSAGHTPLLAVLRPNLITKPPVVLVPKVTVRDLHQAELIFGPAQAAVAKAVADAVEEGVIPKDVVEDIVIIASVFIHPKAKNVHKIYYYNYGATKLALKMQIAMDLTSLSEVKKVLELVPESDHVIFEIGTPLAKKYGVDVVLELRDVRPDAFFVLTQLQTQWSFRGSPLKVRLRSS